MKVHFPYHAGMITMEAIAATVEVVGVSALRVSYDGQSCWIANSSMLAPTIEPRPGIRSLLFVEPGCLHVPKPEPPDGCPDEVRESHAKYVESYRRYQQSIQEMEDYIAFHDTCDRQVGPAPTT